MAKRGLSGNGDASAAVTGPGEGFAGESLPAGPPLPTLPPEETAQPTPEPSPSPAQTPEESGDPAQSEVPEESGDPAQSEAPAESTAPAEASDAPAPQESQEVDGPGSAPTPPGWELAGLGLAAGLLLAGIAALIGRALRRKKVPARSPSGQVAVEKLHEQGARKSQQDSFFVSAGQERMPGDVIRTGPGLLAVVADGMGGLADGDKVSQAAVSAIANGFYQTQGGPEEVLLSLLEQANRAVNTLLGPEGLRRSGSTLAAGLFREGAFYYLSVGDSRICLFRDGALYQLNREHVYRNELYTDAVNGLYSLSEAERHPKGGGLTSYLGMGEVKYVDLPAQPVAVREGDVFLLMSDGVYNALAEEELKAALSAPGSAADALRGAIQAKGYANQDNYTAVILRC